MKAQFKYAFINSFKDRYIVFILLCLVNTVFIILGTLGLLPLAALITSVSLGGVFIAVMLVVNIVGDISIMRRMFSAPGAYLYALTPAPRWKSLFAEISVMTIFDFITMAVAIAQVVWLSLNLTGITGIFSMLNIWDSFGNYFIWRFLLLFVGYLLYVLIIIFSITAYKTILYKKPASLFLALVTGFVINYLASLMRFLLAPFAEISNFGLFFILNLNNDTGVSAYFLLTFLQVILLFIVTSKLMEKRINI